MEITSRFRELYSRMDGKNEHIYRGHAVLLLKWWSSTPRWREVVKQTIAEYKHNAESESSAPFRMEQYLAALHNLAALYKDHLPMGQWDAFLDDFSWMPSLAADLAEREKKRSWEKRRHLMMTF